MLEVNGYYATPRFVFDGEIFKPQSSVYTALYGPKFSFRRNSKFTPFGYVLLGGAVLQGSQQGFSASNASFAAAPGGGVDVRVSDLAAVRVQGDYTYTNFRSFQLATTSGIDHLVLTGPRIRQNNFRITIGIVLRIGEK